MAWLNSRVRLRSNGWTGTVVHVSPTHYDPHLYVWWDHDPEGWPDGPHDPDELEVLR